MTPPEILLLYEEKVAASNILSAGSHFHESFYFLIQAVDIGYPKATTASNDRIDNQVINTKQEHYQSNCQNHGPYRVPCEILGNSCEKQDCSQENSVEHIGIALLFGGLSLFEGGSSLSI